jgi:hypothetical protein
VNPLHFRPENDDRVDTSKEDATDWEDNALSNLYAWASWRFVPRWCEQHDHITSRWANAVFTTCPCCMFYRGLSMGIAATSSVLVIIFALMWVLVR